jgi:hypothetical protein
MMDWVRREMRDDDTNRRRRYQSVFVGVRHHGCGVLCEKYNRSDQLACDQYNTRQWTTEHLLLLRQSGHIVTVEMHRSASELVLVVTGASCLEIKMS